MIGRKTLLATCGTGILFFLSLTCRPVYADKKHIPLDLAVSHNNQGTAFLGKDDLDRAEVEFKTAAEIDPLYAEAHNNLGLIYKYKGHFDEALVEIRKAIKLDPGWAAPYNHLGTVYLATGEMLKAMDYFRRAIQIDGKFADAHFNLGIVYLEKSRTARDPKPDWKDAANAFTKAATIDTRMTQAHLNLADTYRKLGDNEKAILRYRLAIETAPKDPTAWQHLQELYEESGDVQKARKCAEKVRLLKPMPEGALVKMGESYVRQKKYADALSLFNRALEANPKNAMTWFDLGFLFAAQGQSPQAIQAYQRAVSIDPNFFAAWFNLGMAFKNATNTRGALMSFCRSLQVAPSGGTGFKDEIQKAKEAADGLGGCHR